MVMDSPLPPSAEADRSARRSRTSHAAILAAAAAVAAERGYFGATIEEIAARAGTGKQTIYRWWKAKPFLFLEVYGELVPLSEMAVDTGSLRGDFEALLARLLGFYRETPAAAVLAGLIAEAQSDPAGAAAFDERMVRARRGILTGPLARARARGELDDGFDAEFAADLFTAAVWHRLLVGSDRPEPRFIAQLVDSLLQERKP
jgi:AcrR family transcriptional regulator